MSPEQVRGRDVGPPSDVFSLGVLLYEMLVGSSPFEADSDFETLRRIVTREPPPLADVRGDLPPAVVELVHSLLHKEARRRPSAGEAARRLRVLEGRFGRGDRPDFVADPANGAESLQSEPARGESVDGATTRTLRPAAHLLADALRLGLLRAAALDGVSTVSPEVVDPVAPAGSEALPPAEIARATAASEILAARLECAPLSCRIRLQRLDPRGLALWVEDFEVPVDEPHLASRAAFAALRRAYPGRAPDLVGEREGPTEQDYRRFLELRRQFVAGPSAAELESIDDGVSRLLRRSAASVDLHLLAAHVDGRLFALGRDRGHHLQALQHAEQAMARDPHDARAASLSVTLLLEAGELEQARARLREFEASFPADPQVLAARAWLASLSGEVDLALETFAELATRRPSFFNWFRLARFEIEHGRLESARSHLELALAAFPEHRRSRSLLAHLELVGGRVERAAKIYAELAAQRPRLPVLSNLGLAQLLLGRFAEAAESFGRAA
ncbi:MAG: tetratricopeptide repeat protein, partial [Acidobacteriota bacterium]